MAIDFRATVKGFLNWRQPGGALSLGGHALILVASIYAFNSAKPFAPATEALPVDVVSEKDFNEMMKGDKTAKEKAAEPARRVDRVAETKEDKDPGLDKKDVPAIPTKQEAKSEPLPEPKLAAIIPPTRPPELRVTPPLPTPPVRPEPEEELKDAEIIKQKAPPPKKEEPKKAEPQPDQLQKLLEEKQRETDKAKALEDKRRLEEKLKAEEKKKAEDKKKAEAEKKAKEAKAKKDREAKEAAEADKRNNARIEKLLASKETPSSTGSTGAVVSNRATAGTATATGKKLSLSERTQLGGIIAEQVKECFNSVIHHNLNEVPAAQFYISKSGRLIGSVILVNNKADPIFRALAEEGMRAIRECQPYKIPEKFLERYDEKDGFTANLDPPKR